MDVMRYARTLGLGLMVVGLGATGCGDNQTVTPKSQEKNVSKTHDHDHHGEGPNGGIIFDLGKHHAEFTVDHPKMEFSVHFIAGDDKNAKPLWVAATELTLTTKEAKTKEGKVVPPMTIKLLPQDVKEGKASKFVGTDPGIANIADFEGIVNGEIGGKPSSGEFKEEEHAEDKE